MKRLTQSQYNLLPADYRGTVDGKPYALYMDESGRTVYGPVEITDPDKYRDLESIRQAWPSLTAWQRKLITGRVLFYVYKTRAAQFLKTITGEAE